MPGRLLKSTIYHIHKYLHIYIYIGTLYINMYVYKIVHSIFRVRSVECCQLGLPLLVVEIMGWVFGWFCWFVSLFVAYFIGVGTKEEI